MPGLPAIRSCEVASQSDFSSLSLKFSSIIIIIKKKIDKMLALHIASVIALGNAGYPGVPFL